MAVQSSSGEADVAEGVLRTTRCYTQEDGSTILKIFYQCTSCHDELLGIKALKRHMSEVHSLRTSIPAVEDKEQGHITLLRMPDGEGRLVCPICGDHFAETDLEGLKAHANSEHGDAFTYYTSNLLKRAADGRNYYVCDFCEMHFSTASQCTRHVAAQHGEVWTLLQDEASQSSELFDFLHQDRFDAAITYPRLQDLQSRIQVVSLGSFCGVKFSMQRMGLGSSHMPFDWIRTSVKGVTEFVRSGFKDYFSVTTQKKIESAAVHLYRSTKHCFFHDDITQENIQIKLQRRVSRFLALSQGAKDLLFVRAGASTSELQGIDELFAALQERFASANRRVLLLVIVDGQKVRQGPVVHEKIPSIMFYMQPFDIHAMDPDGSAYCEAIASAADLALKVPEGSLPSVGFGLPSQMTMRMGTSIQAEPWDAGLVAIFDGISYPCFDKEGTQLINLSCLTNSFDGTA